MAYVTAFNIGHYLNKTFFKKHNHIIVHSNLQVGGIHLDTEVEVHFYNVSLIHIYQIQGTK